jgi:hypothetical protein
LRAYYLDVVVFELVHDGFEDIVRWHVGFMEGFHAFLVSALGEQVPLRGDRSEQVARDKDLLYGQVAHDRSGEVEVGGEDEGDCCAVLQGVGVFVQVDRVEGILYAIVGDDGGGPLMATDRTGKPGFLEQGQRRAEVRVLVAADYGFQLRYRNQG